MIVLIAIATLFLVAVIGGLTAGLLQTSRLLSVIFYILASGAAVRYLLTPPRKRPKEDSGRKFKLKQHSQEGAAPLPPGSVESALTDEAAGMIEKVDLLVQKAAVAPPAAEAAGPELGSRIPDHALLRELGSYEVIAAGLVRNRGHELTLQPKMNGVFQARESNGTIYITLSDSFEGVGSNLPRLGIQQVFTLWDEQNRILHAFPPGRLQITVVQEAVCRFYNDSTQLALKKKGIVYVTPKGQ